ncbi:hypothetical protein [Brevibacterium paucivorans]|uniref:DUF4012 domain-containing protein n=1 Tax=Brevibacterium paucivorans TaxID=170994 RepID=A0A2N6VLU4_9MICO|nr:hypothetical protein [Brevibacterium paucivorans]PMD05086.1 hypothetical protein CJ199_08315 [Brevibacterium paucivorans]
MTAPTKVYKPRKKPGSNKKSGLRGFAFVIVVILVAIIAFVALLTARVNAVTRHAEAASEAGNAFIEALSNDPENAQGHLDRARDELGQAKDNLHSIPIEQMHMIPWVKRNVDASDTLITHMENVLNQAGPVMISLSGVVDFNSGSLKSNPDLSSLNPSLVGDAREAAKVIKSAREAIHGIDTAGLLPDVHNAVHDAREMLDTVYRKIAPLESIAEDVKKYLPPGVAKRLEELGNLLGG